MMARRGTGSSGAVIEEHHQPPSISRVAAPIAMAARCASPVLVPAAALQRASVGCGRYCSRICWLCSKPPAASTTARRARTTCVAPLRVIFAPVTRPASSVSSSVICDSSHSGMLRSCIDQRRRATPAQPQAMRRERLLVSAQPTSLTWSQMRRAARPFQPGSCAISTCASTWVMAMRSNIHIMWCVSRSLSASALSTLRASGAGSSERCPCLAPGRFDQ